MKKTRRQNAKTKKKVPRYWLDYDPRNSKTIFLYNTFIEAGVDIPTSLCRGAASFRKRFCQNVVYRTASRSQPALLTEGRQLLYGNLEVGALMDLFLRPSTYMVNPIILWIYESTAM